MTVAVSAKLLAFIYAVLSIKNLIVFFARLTSAIPAAITSPILHAYQESICSIA